MTQDVIHPASARSDVPIRRVKLRRSEAPFRVELVPLELKPLEAGAVVTDAAPPPARTLSLDASGGMFLDREPIALEAVVPTLQATLEEDPETVLYLAVADEVGPTDRIPVLLELWNQLRIAEIPIRMVGRVVDTGTEN